MSTAFNAKQYILNCIPSRDTEKDWTWEAAEEAGAVKMVNASDLPSSVDLRDNDWTVRNQGSSGACVGFAAADGVLRFHFAKRQLTTFKDMPSPRFLWMADKETDAITDYPTTFIEVAGTQVKNALDIARLYGCVMEDDLPMTGALWRGKQEAFYTKTARLRIASYHTLGRDPVVWRNWLASNGPILTRLDVEATWDNATATKGRLDNYDPTTKRGGHAVCLVGYTADSLIVRNSWGQDWGDKGFGYASAAYARNAFTEAYGVVI